MDSSKYKPFDQAILRQKGARGEIFPPGDGVCVMRFYYKMWGSQHMGRLQIYVVTKGNYFNSKTEAWKTRGNDMCNHKPVCSVCNNISYVTKQAAFHDWNIVFLFPVLRFQGDPNNDNWIRVELPLDSAQKFSIEFVATLGTGEKGDIAIDDVSFSDGCEVGGDGHDFGHILNSLW